MPHVLDIGSYGKRSQDLCSGRHSTLQCSFFGPGRAYTVQPAPKRVIQECVAVLLGVLFSSQFSCTTLCRKLLPVAMQCCDRLDAQSLNIMTFHRVCGSM